MKLIIQGTALGELPHYISATRAIHAPTILELMELLEDGARAIDPVGLRNYFERRPDGKRTCFLGAELLPAGTNLYGDDTNRRCTRRALPNPSRALFPLLETVVKELLAQTTRIAVALSGGLDSALVLALAQRTTQHSIPVITLETGLPGYSELEQTMETARLLGANTMEVIKVRDTDLISSLPESIAACETPLFNLHPVARFLLARSAAERGFDAILTGDGADQVFAGSDPRNYLPIVGAMVRSTGLRCLSPFFDERVISWAKHDGANPDKTGLREAATEILPAELAWRKKTPRLTPDFDLSRYRDPELEDRLAPQLGLTPPESTAGPQQTLWATTAILLRHMGGTS